MMMMPFERWTEDVRTTSIALCDSRREFLAVISFSDFPMASIASIVRYDTDTTYHIVVLQCPRPDVDYLPIPHPPSLSCTSMQTLSQLHSAHLGHLYAPKYPHEEHIRLGGVDGAGAVADKYGGTGSAGYTGWQEMSQSVFKVKA